jgi:hypothetical protein
MGRDPVEFNAKVLGFGPVEGVDYPLDNMLSRLASRLSERLKCCLVVGTYHSFKEFSLNGYVESHQDA